MSAIFFGETNPLVMQYVQPTAGQTVNINPNTDVLMVDPAGLLLTLTIVLPSAADGKRVGIGCSQIITTLTLTGTIVGALTTMALGGFAEFVFSGSASKWFRTG